MKYNLLFSLLIFISFGANAQIGQKIKSADNSFSGTWENKDMGYSMILVFNANGTGSFDGTPMTYTKTGSTFTMTEQGNSPVTYNYSIQNSILSLSGGDLSQPIKFQKKLTSGNSVSNSSSFQVKETNENKPGNNSLIGKWQGNNEILEIKQDGTLVLNGIALTYIVSGNNITIATPQGQASGTYNISNNNYLSITINGTTTMYSRSGSSATNSTQVGSSGNLKGVIAPELVGKWCYFSSSSSSSGGWSTERCITINADGSYIYFYSSGGSASVNNQYGTQTAYGSTQGQNTDRGTWRLDGSVLYVNSQSQGMKMYKLEKINNKNGDPMIVIDGEQFVTYYRKNPW